MPRYPVGKLPHRQLERLLQRFAPTDRPDVLIGPRVGQDAAVLRLPPRRRSSPGQWTLVAATDPVTFTAERIGWYAVQINANDVAVMGATPRWFLACLLLPQRWPHRPARIFDDIATACQELHVAAVGGHTEVTAGLDRPIVIGQMLGLARTDCIVHADRARPGQAIIMTKSAAIEATAIIARQHARRLASQCSQALLRRARSFLFKPGISIVREAAICTAAGASAMHDPTEGGVLTGLWEMARAANRRFVVDPNAIAVRPETRRLCQLVGIDPLRSIGSGCLLATIAARRAGPLIRRLKTAGTDARQIGYVTTGAAGLVDPSGQPIPISATDEIARL